MIEETVQKGMPFNKKITIAGQPGRGSFEVVLRNGLFARVYPLQLSSAGLVLSLTGSQTQEFPSEIIYLDIYFKTSEGREKIANGILHVAN